MGNDDEKVLSQADVDALVALVPDAPRTAASPTISAKSIPEEKPMQTAVAEPAPLSVTACEPTTSNNIPSSEIVALQKTINDLTRQVNKLANTTQRLDLLEETTGQLARLIQHSAHHEQIPVEIIDEIQAEIQDLSQHLNHRNEFKENFECTQCKSKGTMAILTKCTSCGQERWFGWWPKKIISDHKPFEKSLPAIKYR